MRRIFLFGLLLLTSTVLAGTEVEVGQNYLFNDTVRYRSWGEAWQRNAVTNALDVIVQIDKQLKNKNIQLLVAIVPIRERILPEYLPNTFVLSPAVAGIYDQALATFAKNLVFAPDLNAAFLSSPDRRKTFGLFMRQDHHWSPSGALLAAKEIAKYSQLNLRKSLIGIPKQPSTLVWNRPVLAVHTSLRDQLGPSEQARLPQEMIRSFSVDATTPNNNGLFGDDPTNIVVTGTSYTTNLQYGFADGLRFAFQRPINNVSQGAKGYWVPFIEYLEDASFLEAPPKILIWEIPEAQLNYAGAPVCCEKDGPALFLARVKTALDKLESTK